MRKIYCLIVCILLNFQILLFAQTTVPAGSVFGNWTLAGSPYLITGSIQVPKDSTLTLQPGVVVNFQGYYKFYVLGSLKATGTITDSISFTAQNTTTGWWGIRFDGITSIQDSSIFKYCKIQHGKASGTAPDNLGGGFYIKNFSKIRISNSLIKNCSAVKGGGIYCGTSNINILNNSILYNSNTTIGIAGGGGICCSGANVKITNNNISYNSAFQDGGGILCESNSSAIISNNTISYNNLTSSNRGGGGISCESSAPTISYNNIKNNSSVNDGGGIGSFYGNGPTVTHNTIINNTAASGGGIGGFSTINLVSNNTISNNTANGSGGGDGGGGIFYNGGTVTNNLISNNLYSGNNTNGGGGGVRCQGSGDFIDNIIINNTVSGANSFGGGIYCGNIISGSASPNIYNCTIANNNATGVSGGGGGLFCINSSNPILKNTIIWGNVATSSNGANIYLSDNGSDPQFNYSNIQGGSAGFFTNGNPYTGTYTNNINANPLFISPSGGAGSGFNGLTANWQLQNSSPCVNTGDPTTLTPSTDLAGNPRVTVCRIDMGAYENQYAPPFTVTAVSQNILCNGGTGSATVTAVNGTAPYIYNWSSGQATATVTGLSAGNYTVTATDANSCSRTKTLTITQPAVLNATTASTATACNSNTGILNVTVSGGTAPYSYLWSTTPTQTTAAATSLGVGSYTATVTDANGCTKTASSSVTVKPNPSASISTSPSNCNAPTGTATVSATGGTSPYTYLWSDGQATQTASGLATGNYTVTITDVFGCAKTATASVAYKPSPTLTFTNSPSNCNSSTGTATVNATGGTSPYTYLWNDGQITQTASGLATGNYTVTVTDIYGCAKVATTSVIYKPNPIVSITINQNVSCNGGSNGFATANASGGVSPYTYLWNNSQTSQIATGLSASNYTVTVTDSNGCAGVASMTITQPVALVASVTLVTDASCGNADGGASASATGGTVPYSYLWSNTATASIVNGLIAGNYSVTVTDANSCATSTTIAVNNTISHAAPNICSVTVDSLSTNNLILWDKTQITNRDTVIIYRDIANNNYAIIGRVPYDSLSQFADTVRTLYASNGDPNVSSWRYKISVKDSCGNESALSLYHQTIFFQNSNGNFSWNQYQIEGQIAPINPLQNYVFRRDNLSDGNWANIQTLSASSTAFTDLNYALYQLTAKWRVQTIWNISCDPTLKVANSTVNTTRSNTKDKISSIPTGIKENTLFEVNLFPNPAKDVLRISTTNQLITLVKVYDITARLLSQVSLQNNDNKIDISIKDFASGIYLAEIQTAKGIVRKQFVKE